MATERHDDDQEEEEGKKKKFHSIDRRMMTDVDLSIDLAACLRGTNEKADFSCTCSLSFVQSLTSESSRAAPQPFDTLIHACFPIFVQYLFTEEDDVEFVNLLVVFLRIT